MTKHRRTVRIVKKRTIPRAAYVSLAAAAAAAALLFTLWRALKSEDPPAPHIRLLDDVELEWRCADGHRFTAYGETTPVACPTCGEDAYPVASFQCPVHGNFDVAFQFKQDAGGRAAPTAMKAPGGAWEPFSTRPHCPRCRRPMKRESVDPLATREDSRPARDGR